MVTLPTFLPVSEAARKYGLEEARLRTLIEKGKIRAGVVAGEMVVSEAPRKSLEWYANEMEATSEPVKAFQAAERVYLTRHLA